MLVFQMVSVLEFLMGFELVCQKVFELVCQKVFELALYLWKG